MNLRYPFRFRDAAIRSACEKRAEEKGLSLNEWMNRALTHAATRGGAITITHTETLEF